MSSKTAVSSLSEEELSDTSVSTNSGRSSGKLTRRGGGGGGVTRGGGPSSSSSSSSSSVSFEALDVGGEATAQIQKQSGARKKD